MFGFLFNKTFGGVKRSSKWRTVRKEHLKKHPVCAATGSKRKPEVHHIKPFHLYPELELEPSNLITLAKRYHLLFGHLGSFHSYNLNVRANASEWRGKIIGRP